ncbi:YybH family protein [Flagellimonas sp. GZD32]|uniref:YybH family protein n=1 Tax=Flagellimonas cixiensis TaxID=3228750 RepID=UPI0035C8C62F
MKTTQPYLFAVLCILLFSSELFSQTDKEQILSVRKASNAALKSYSNKEVLSYLTEDVLTTTGNGTLLCGKEELEHYILEGGESKMYWVRDTKDIVINEKRGLAWETGIWNGYDPEKSSESIVNGNYSAMWTKASGEWKIKSQLFVTLGEK